MDGWMELDTARSRFPHPNGSLSNAVTPPQACITSAELNECLFSSSQWRQTELRMERVGSGSEPVKSVHEKYPFFSNESFRFILRFTLKSAGWRTTMTSAYRRCFDKKLQAPPSVVATLSSKRTEPGQNRHAKRRRCCGHVVAASGAGLTSSSSSRSNTRLAFFLLCRTCSAVALGSARSFFPAPLASWSLFLVRFVSAAAARFFAGGAMFVLV